MAPTIVMPPSETNLLVARSTREISALREENARLAAPPVRLEEEASRLRERLEREMKAN